MAAVSTKSLFLVNGKNARVTEDLERRTLPVYMAVRSRLNRTFKHHNLRSYAIKNRPRLLMLALKSIAAYLQANDPVKGIPEVPGFDDWDTFCRRTLIFYGYADPATPILEALANRASDCPDQKFAELLVELIGSGTLFGTAEVAILLEGEHGSSLLSFLPPHVIDASGGVNRRVLGHALAAWSEQADLNGLAIQCTGDAPRCRYVLRRIAQVSED